MPLINNWTATHTAIPIPMGGYDAEMVEQGRYRPAPPVVPASHGFSIIAKVAPGRAEGFYSRAKQIEKLVEDDPKVLAALKAHYLKWVVFNIDGESYLMYQGLFDTDFDTYMEDAVDLFNSTGIAVIFEDLEGWPEDWKNDPEACVNYFRNHQCPSFLEYSDHPQVTAEEINKALKIKAAFSDMLDQCTRRA